ncbi:zinc-ribbon domain-containing protein [Clostridium perfringens]|nr:zinc-ribbon domain-containing protein [Clostridium perfringens]
MFCSKCGKEIPNESVFCPECGNKCKKVLTCNVIINTI